MIRRKSEMNMVTNNGIEATEINSCRKRMCPHDLIDAPNLKNIMPRSKPTNKRD